MSTLAINIITTHDEPYLEDALKCAQRLEAECVIAYTGDVTRKEYETCLRYFPNSTHVFAWNNNFSDARNFCKEKTKSDWVLWLDSDETIEESSIDKIKALIKNGPKNLWHKFKLIHGSTTMGQTRMFLNVEKIRWIGAVHEKVVPETPPEYHADIEITHRVQNIARSSARNMAIILEELQRKPNDPDANFYAAIEYHLIGQQMRALYHAEKFLYHYPISEIDARKMYMRYLIAWINANHLRNYQKAIEILTAQLILNANIAEFWCLLGDVYLYLGKFPAATRFYKNAILMGMHKFENMWLVDLDKYDSYPKLKISQCEQYLKVDMREFEREAAMPIMP